MLAHRFGYIPLESCDHPFYLGPCVRNDLGHMGDVGDPGNVGWGKDGVVNMQTHFRLL